VRAAVRRINADKKAYMHYFIDYYAKKDPEIAADLRESRLVVCDPAPIPLDELQRTYDWLKSWGMLEETASPLQLINEQMQSHAHQAAESIATLASTRIGTTPSSGAAGAEHGRDDER
jgi:hypothetical protein